MNLKLTSQAKGVARVNMLMRAHLFWLAGFPLARDGHWYWCCPAMRERDKQQLLMTPALLSKAQRVIYELLRDYPLALTKVVGEVPLWQQRCQSYLELTKCLLATKPKESARDLFKQDASLQAKLPARLSGALWQHDFVACISWWHFVQRDALVAALSFVQGYLLSAQPHDPWLLARLCQIYIEYGDKAAPLIELQLNTRWHGVATEGMRTYVQPYLDYAYDPKRNKSYSFPIRPQANHHRAVLSSLEQFEQASAAQQKNYLALLKECCLNQVFSDLQQWWQQLDPLIQKIQNIWQYQDGHKRARIVALKDELQALQNQAPHELLLPKVLDGIVLLSQQNKLSKQVCSLLQRYPALSDHPSWRWRYLSHCCELYQNAYRGEAYLAHYLREWTEFLAQRTEDKLPLSWGDLPNVYWRSYEYDIFDAVGPKQLADFFHLLAQLLQLPNQLKHSWVEGLALMVGSGFNGELALGLARHLIHSGKMGDLSKPVLMIALSEQLDFAQIDTLLSIYNKLNQEYTAEDTLVAIYQTFNKIQRRDLFKQLLFSEPISVLRHSSDQIRLVLQIQPSAELPAFPVPPPIAATWQEQYPAIFQPLLAQLNANSRQAEKIARKVFQADWWPKPLLEAEIEQLQTRLALANESQQTAIQARLANLQHGLSQHQAPSELQQQRLSSKLQQRISQAQFQHWQTALNHWFRHSWAAFLDIAEPDLADYLVAPNMMPFWLPIASFNRANQQLARMVIRQRCLTKDWWFVDHPTNQLYLQQLSNMGFNCQAWLAGIPPLSYTSQSGKLITIARLHDPLEALNMGGYFDSCLSPGRFNYFSVFANICDINKWVIYGKTSDHKVVGRVLIALTPAGGVKVFHRYYHNAEDEFQLRVMQYIQAWAQEAGFVLTEHGKVPCLLAHDWYDDGAKPVDYEMPCLQAGSIFRQQLRHMSNQDFVALAQQALAPIPLNELTIPLLAELPELHQRPELLLSLIKLAANTANLGAAELSCLFQWAHSSQCGEAAYAALRKALLKKLRHQLKQHWHLNLEVVGQIAHYHPSDALTLIKHYGQLEAGRWQDNLYPQAAKLAVSILDTLGRCQQAQRLVADYRLDPSLKR